MPATLQPRSPWRRLTLREFGELLLVLVRMAALNHRMSVEAARIDGPLNERPEFRAAARTWCELSARLSAITGNPEHEDASELRALFGLPDPLPSSPPVGMPARVHEGRVAEMPTKH